MARASAVRDAELFVAVALDSSRAGERAENFVRIASAVERDRLPPESMVTTDELDWDAAGERVTALRRTRFDDLVLAGRYPKHAWPEDPLAAKPRWRPRRDPIGRG